MKTDADIAAFLRAFEDCSLPRSDWTHAAHLVVALCYLIKHPRHEATERIREGIKRYNLSQGNPTGYHETITLAWIAVIARFLETCGRDESISILADRLLGECGASDYLLRFYSRDRLFSDEARRTWIAPELAEIE